MPSRRSVLVGLSVGVASALAGCDFASSSGESTASEGETPADATLAPTATLTAPATPTDTESPAPTDTPSSVPTTPEPPRTATTSAAATPTAAGEQVAEFSGEDSRQYDKFGASVATDGDALLVAAPEDSHPDLEDIYGSTYVFGGSGESWTQQAKLSPEAEALPFDYQFGTDVTVSGDRAVVGAQELVEPQRIPRGGAFVYERVDGEWQQVATLRSDAGPARDWFGRSVELDGDRIAVGAPQGRRADGTNTGVAYVYTRDECAESDGTDRSSQREPPGDENCASPGEWRREAKLAPPDGGKDVYFGDSVALDGDRLLVGAHGFDTSDGDTVGKAYLFERADGEWSHRTSLTPTADHDDEDHFGSSVALDGDTALVASWGDDDPNGFYAGSAYAFERIDGRWIMDTKLAPDDGEREDVFGSSVALDGDTALVGAQHDNTNGDDAGSAYLFGPENGEWAQRTKLLPDDGQRNGRFGTSAALTDGRGFVGALYEGTAGMPETGAVYVFST